MLSVSIFPYVIILSRFYCTSYIIRNYNLYTRCYDVCFDVCYDICFDVCYDICFDVCYDVCFDVCFDVCYDICYDICFDSRITGQRQVQSHDIKFFSKYIYFNFFVRVRIQII